MSIARDAGIISEAQQKEIDELFTGKDGKFDEEAFAEAFARELKRAFHETVQKRMEDVPATKAGRALRRVADFIATLAKSFAFWRQERGLDPVTGQPLQAGQVLDAFLKSARTSVDEATRLDNLARAARAASLRATAEARDNAPTQTVTDEDGTVVAYHERGDRVSAEEDAAYLDAVRRVDMGAAQRMVEERAQEAGYTVPAFHGTGRFGFTVFDPMRTLGGGTRPASRRTVFFGEQRLAESYSGERGAREIGRPIPKIGIERIRDDASLYEEVKRVADAVGAKVSVRLYGGDVVDAPEDEAPFDTILISLDANGVQDEYELFSISHVMSTMGKAWSVRDAAESLADEVFWWLDGLKDRNGNYRVALKMENPLTVDAKGESWLRVPLPDGGMGDTHDLAAWALEHGYDGVVIKNVIDNGGKTNKDFDVPMTEHIVFDPEQIKSLDPVTYDDNGNVIPLSRRFDAGNVDIRYHISESSETQVENTDPNEERRDHISGLYTGGPVPYWKPNLAYVGSNSGRQGDGWGHYAANMREGAVIHAPEGGAVMWQTWWTHRPEGDESHLLVDGEPLSKENAERVAQTIVHLKEEYGVTTREMDEKFWPYFDDANMTGDMAYRMVEEFFRLFTDIENPARAASRALYMHDIDGVKIPMGEETDADGKPTGKQMANYVAFSDEHLRVDHVYEYNPETDDFELKWHTAEGSGPRFTETPLGQELVARAFDAIMGSRVDLLLRPSRYYGNPYETRERNPRNALVTEHLHRDVDVSEPRGFATEVSAEISQFGTREGDPTLREIRARCGSKARFYEVLGAVYETAVGLKMGVFDVITQREFSSMEKRMPLYAWVIRHNAQARATELGRKAYIMGRQFAERLRREAVAAARAEVERQRRGRGDCGMIGGKCEGKGPSRHGERRWPKARRMR